MDEGQAHALAGRIAATAGYVIVAVRRAWPTAWAWQVEVTREHTGQRLTLLSDDGWDDHLAYTSRVVAQQQG